MPYHDGFPVRGPRPPVTEPGVPSQYIPHVHPWPTRYHGGIWTRPVTAPATYVRSVQSVFKPDDFNANNPGIRKMGIAGLGALQYQTYAGVFGGNKHGGGVFSGPLYGLGSALGVEISPMFTAKTTATTSAPAKTTAPALKSPDSRVSALQGYLNRVLDVAGLPAIGKDGQLGPKTCGAIYWYGTTGKNFASGTTKQRIDEQFSYLAPLYAAACAKHTPWPIPKKSAAAPAISTPSGPDTSTPMVYKPRGMSTRTKAAVGMGVGALGAAGLYVLAKKRGWLK